MARLTVWNVDHYEAEVDGVIHRGSITEALGILEDEKEKNDKLIFYMAKELMGEFGRCALCDNHMKNITIDRVNNGCDGNCTHNKKYAEKDLIEWYLEEIKNIKGEANGTD